MSVAEFFRYLLVHQPSRELAVQLAEAYAARAAAAEARASRAELTRSA